MKAFTSRAGGAAAVSTLLWLFVGPANAQDHQHCFKIKDSATAAQYSADLAPSDTGYVTGLGCTIKVPAKMVCIDVDKTNVTPTPPGADPGLPAQKSLCYKIKCPKFDAIDVTEGDQFGTRAISVKKSAYLCAPIPAPATTSTTTTMMPSGCLTAGDCSPLPNATVGCTAGDCVIASCLPGYADCNVSAADGCEVNTDSDTGNCGTCGAMCAMPPNGTAQCQVGTCAVASCVSGYADCNATFSDGCETGTTGDPSHCGSCGNMCPVPPNATAACSASACGIGSCNAGFADCNVSPGDGCEVNTFSDVNNCGACANVCFVTNGSPACIGATCAVASCSVGFDNCNLTPVDGCETSTTNDPNNCGACGNVCGGGTPNCVASTCVP